MYTKSERSLPVNGKYKGVIEGSSSLCSLQGPGGLRQTISPLQSPLSSNQSTPSPLNTFASIMDERTRWEEEEEDGELMGMGRIGREGNCNSYSSIPSSGLDEMISLGIDHAWISADGAKVHVVIPPLTPFDTRYPIIIQCDFFVDDVIWIGRKIIRIECHFSRLSPSELPMERGKINLMLSYDPLACSLVVCSLPFWIHSSSSILLLLQVGVLSCEDLCQLSLSPSGQCLLDPYVKLQLLPDRDHKWGRDGSNQLGGLHWLLIPDYSSKTFLNDCMQEFPLSLGDKSKCLLQLS